MTDKTATAKFVCPTSLNEEPDETSLLLSVQALCGIDLSSGAGSPGPLFVGAILTKPWKISRPADGAGTRSVSVVDESGMLHDGRASSYQPALIAHSIGDYLQPVSGQTGYLWFINTKLEKAVGIDMVHNRDFVKSLRKSN